MTIRADLCALRDRVDQLCRDLPDVERRVVSRNTAHLICRATSMARATGELISQALQQPLEEASAEQIEARS